MLELDCGLEFDSARPEDFFAALPPRPAVCLIEPREDKADPFLIRTQDLRRRLQRLLGVLDVNSKRLNLQSFARGVRYRLTGSALEQTFTYYQNAKQFLPHRYTKILRLRPPAVLKVSLRNAYPRCFVTRRIPVDDTGAPTAGATTALSLLENPPKPSPNALSIYLRCGVVKSKSAATPRSPDAFIPR